MTDGAMKQRGGRSWMAQALRTGSAALAVTSVLGAAFGVGPASAEVLGRLILGAGPGGVRASTLSGAYLSGSYALSQNDLGTAANYMALALSQDPASAELRRTTFRLMVRNGQLEAAVPLARTILEHESSEALAGTLLMLEEVRNGNLATAREQIDRIPRRDVANFAMPLVQAWMVAGLGDREAALRILDTLAQIPGAQALTEMHRGLILDLAGDLPAAISALEAAVARGQPFRLVVALGSLYERAGRRDDAAALYRRYSEENPGSVLMAPILARFEAGQPAAPIIGSPRDGVAEALFQVASALSQEGAHDQALVYCRLSLFLRPEFPLGHILLGDVLSDFSQHEAALAVYREVDPATPEGWLARIQVSRELQRLERDDEALALLATMAEERTDRADPLIETGDIHRAARRFTEAVTAYDRAQSRAPGVTDRDWSFFYRRGIALERAHVWDRAETDLRHALELNPDYAHLLNYLGYSLLDRGEDLEESERLIRRAIELMPNDGYIIDSLGWYFYRTGQLQEAVTTLERAVETQSEDATINDHLGDAYWMVGRRIEARFQWERALRTVDEDELRARIEDKLAHGLTDPGILTNAGPAPGTAPSPAPATPDTRPL